MGDVTDAPVSDETERELKFSAAPEFVLPDLTSIIAGSRLIEGEELELDAVYYDTSDLRLARGGMTFRRRTGEGPQRWTLKFPEAHPGGAEVLSRREIEMEHLEVEPPPRLVSILVAEIGPVELEEAARLTTRRRVAALVGPDGSRICSIADDGVSVFMDGEHQPGFREVELEFEREVPADDIRRLARVMSDGGAGRPDPTPKLVRALGARLDPNPR